MRRSAVRLGHRVGPFPLRLDPDLIRTFAEATGDRSRHAGPASVVPPVIVSARSWAVDRRRGRSGTGLSAAKPGASALQSVSEKSESRGRMKDIDSEAGSLIGQLSARRSEQMVTEVEAVALRLFDERGFGDVTVEDIATAAGISPRTFYRYFPSKEDVLQVRIERRSDALRAALAVRPDGEQPLVSLRTALHDVLVQEDSERIRLWTDVIIATPSVLRGVYGGIQLKSHRVMAEFFAARLGLPADGLVPSVLAAAAGGVVQAAQTRWIFHGGDLAATVAQGLRVLEAGTGADAQGWAKALARAEWPPPPAP
jgi:TetR/AcrR family transcriptional regulator, regulator of mycofactocin system